MLLCHVLCPLSLWPLTSLGISHQYLTFSLNSIHVALIFRKLKLLVWWEQAGSCQLAALRSSSPKGVWEQRARALCFLMPHHGKLHSSYFSVLRASLELSLQISREGFFTGTLTQSHSLTSPTMSASWQHCSWSPTTAYTHPLHSAWDAPCWGWSVPPVSELQQEHRMMWEQSTLCHNPDPQPLDNCLTGVHQPQLRFLTGMCSPPQHALAYFLAWSHKAHI